MSFAESGVSTLKRNKVIASLISKGRTVADMLEDEALWCALEENGARLLDESDMTKLREAKGRLANYAMTLDSLMREGYTIIPVTDERFPRKLKSYCKFQTPTILYAKGALSLLNSNMTAIVGSRKSSQTSLDFTERVAARVASEGRVVVSGFAKGVDQTASMSALDAGGTTVAVLPQGIRTAGAVFKRLYIAMNEGRALCVSLFPPNMPWSVGLAMERNNYIYGLADEIYAAESDSHGGTWEGVRNGIRRGAVVYVRMPEPDEKCANGKLIEQGAVPVDRDGRIMEEASRVPKRLTGEVIAEEAAKLFSDSVRVLRVKNIRTQINCSNSEKDIAKALDARSDIFEKKESGVYVKKEAGLL